jgi:hypothetical protein
MMRNYGIEYGCKEKYGMMLFKNYSRIKKKTGIERSHARRKPGPQRGACRYPPRG